MYYSLTQNYPIARTMLLKDYVYEEPSSFNMTALCVFSFLATLYLGISEATGMKHLRYSKFWNVGYHKDNKQILLRSRIGMLVLYTPALVAAISSFGVFRNHVEIRFLMLKSALTIHFLKRVLEVLFVHKFSGFITLDTTIIISLIYLTSSAAMLYFQNETQGLPEPSTDLKYIGLVVFLVGISGNFYHHYLLSKLRENSEKGHKIPKGGLFNKVTCPHYLFEIIGFLGCALISQTLFSYTWAFGSALYLFGRSHATRKWYTSKFESFPKNVKALIPYVF